MADLTALKAAVAKLLVTTYELPNGQRVQAQSISFISEELRMNGWRGVSNLKDLEYTLQSMGFKTGYKGQMVRESRTGDRLCAPARIVMG